MSNLMHTSRIVLLFIAITILSFTAKATTYTAIASGDFNAGSTWAGGVAPGATVNGDTVTIYGYTVTLTANETFTGTSCINLITSSSKLISGTNSTALILSSGYFNLMGGSIIVDSLVTGPGAVITGSYCGATKFTSLGGTISSVIFTVQGTVVRLLSGTLQFTSGANFSFGGTRLEISGGKMAFGASFSNFYAFLPHDVVYTGASAIGGPELSDTNLRKVIVNVPGTLTLSADLKMVDTLNLVSGSLVLNGHNLVFDSTADLISSLSGNINSSALSDVSVVTNKSLSSGLSFLAGHDTVRNLRINTKIASAIVPVSSHMVVGGLLTLNSGKIMLSNDDLLITHPDSTAGGSDSSYVAMTGNGRLSVYIPANDTASFKTGTAQHYAPLVIADSTGTVNSVVSVNVADKVYTDGISGLPLSATQPVVNATWFVSSSVTSGINYNMLASWGAGLEVNGFNRNRAYISHYTNNAWDVQPFAPASSNGSMYTLTRKGITSLSPFAVADTAARLVNVPVVANNNIAVSIYPNPATDMLYFNTTAKFSTASIYDLSGRIVKSITLVNNAISIAGLLPGYYIVQLSGEGIRATPKFIKQ